MRIVSVVVINEEIASLMKVEKVYRFAKGEGGIKYAGQERRELGMGMIW